MHLTVAAFARNPAAIWYSISCLFYCSHRN